MKKLESKDILLDLPFGVIEVKIDEIIETARDSKLFENDDFASVGSIVVKDDESWRREIENIIYVENNEEMVERLETLVIIHIMAMKGKVMINGKRHHCRRLIELELLFGILQGTAQRRKSNLHCM